MKTKMTIVALMLTLIGCAATEGERIRSRIDAIAIQTQRAAETLRDAASGAAAYGVPGAGIVALVAGAVGTAAGLYNERRRRTAPLKSAITQIVHGVEAAFPDKTTEQKTALGAAQDAATQRLVREIRRSRCDSLASRN